MSRRRKPQPDLSDPWRSRRVQLVCTDRGQHERTHIGWVRAYRSREDAWPGESNKDGVGFTTEHDGTIHEGLVGLGQETLNRETGEFRSDDDWTDDADDSEFRKRLTPSRLCERCQRDVQLNEPTLARIIREADAQNVLRIDVSRMG